MAEPSSRNPFLASPADVAPVQIELVSSHTESSICRIRNDLSVAVEVRLEDSDRWEVLYPSLCLELDTSSDLPVSVRLRDDAEISGVCETATRGTLCTSTDFGHFSAAAAKFIDDELAAARREAALREDRKRELGQALSQHVARAQFSRLKNELFSACVFVTTLLLAPMVYCTVRAYLSYEEKKSLKRRFLTLHLGSLVIGFCCTVAMTVAFGIGGFGWPILCLWLFPLVAVCCPCSTVCLPGIDDEENEVPLCFMLWPHLLLRCCGGWDRVWTKLKRPRRQALQRAVLDTNQNTIVFEGNVIPGRKTVSSWPGKYESAWDTLVKHSRQDGISAAVVFLPEGSEHFGIHDKIPKQEAKLLPPHLTRGGWLTRGCWCIPLYGEKKPWGCRWWSRWIENIERAVEQGATLEVYYFNKMVGKGKVQSFITAGEEHLRREEIFNRKSRFKKSASFLKALEAGLEQLPTDKGPDSSSPYSREEHRLFLSWLPEKDRRFLEESEGLGNSQKAEVAWLERKGYDYVEKEVDALAESPKSIGPAAQSTSSSTFLDCERIVVA